MIIAQLTDPHIKRGRRTAYGRVDTASLFEAAIDHVNRLTPGIDAAIVTGDLTDTGSAEEYAEVRPILDRLTCPYFVIPGNHDNAKAMRAAFHDHDYLPETGAFLH
ncbi:MAG: metallophosphoesterase, partial [Hyphomicrobiales bacterium]